MKCQSCGHEYPSTLTRCTRCKQINPTKAQRSQSKLLEFPPRPRTAAEKEPPQAKLPAWRAEVSERVRAAKAKRSGSSIDGPEEITSISPEEESPSPSIKQSETRTATPATFSNSTGAATGIARPTTVPIEQVEQPSAPNVSISRPTSNLVEAALTRVRRASENANRAMLPRIGPSPVTQPATKPALTVDREATARAIEIDLESKPLNDSTPEKIRVPAPRPQEAEEVKVKTVSIPTQPVIDYKESYSTVELDGEADMIFTEIEPRDYLAEEVSKVSRSDEAYEGLVPLGTHIVINAVDLVVLTLSCAPFLASMMITGTDHINTQTLSAVALIALVVSFFYFVVTQALCGKTFGMMITNTRVVSLETGEDLSIQQSLIRTVGYFASLVPALLGFIWIAFNSPRRGLHDILSGSIVIRDTDNF